MQSVALLLSYTSLMSETQSETQNRYVVLNHMWREAMGMPRATA